MSASLKTLNEREMKSQMWPWHVHRLIRTGLLLAIAFVMGRGIAQAVPGDLDLSFNLNPQFIKPWFDPELGFVPNRQESKIGSLAISDGLPLIQLYGGTVLRLDAQGEPDANFAESPVEGIRRKFPIHPLPDGQFLVFNPPRMIGANGETIRQIELSNHSPYDGAILADGSLLGTGSGGLARLPLGDDRFELAEPFLQEVDFVGKNCFVPANDEGWLIISWRPGGINSLIRLHADGSIDKQFQPKRSHYTTAVVTDTGAVYVVADSRAQKIVRLLKDGSQDPEFTPFVLPDTVNTSWEILSIAFDPSSGGLFVGAGRDGSASLSTISKVKASLFYLDSEGKVDAFFTENAAVVGSVRGLAKVRDKLYVLGDLRKRDAEELTPRLVRLEADLSAGTPPLILTSPADTAVAYGQATRLAVEAVTNGAPMDYQWLKDRRAINGATQAELVIPEASFEDSGVYSAIVTASGFSVCSDSAHLYVSGVVSLVDPEFARDLDIGYDDDPSSTEWVSATPFEDGSILLNGSFTSVNGVPSSSMVRLQPNGTLDTSFPANHPLEVFGAKKGVDGALYGRIRDAERTVVSPLGRRTVDGQFESFPLPDGFEDIGIIRLLVQPQDGKIVFPLRRNPPSLGASLFRFLPDGQVDSSYGPVNFSGITDDELHAAINDLVLLDDGKILVAGRWGAINEIDSGAGFSRGLVRLNADGSLDDTFHFAALDPIYGTVLQLQSVGDRILLFSGFKLLMIDREGRVDTSFVSEFAPLVPVFISRAYLAPSGDVYLEQGSSRSDSQYPSPFYLRMLPSGTVDRPINFVANTPTDLVSASFLPHLDGMLVAGDFLFIDDVYRPEGIARLRTIDSVRVVFADPRLESAIQEVLELSQKPITVKTLAGLTDLRLDGRGITDLRGLENARSLHTLSLNNNAISDLTPLSELPLTSLSAANNEIAALPESFEVEVLTLDGNPVSDGPTLSVDGPTFSVNKVVTNIRCGPGRNGSVRTHYEHGLILEWATEVGTHHRLETSTDLKKWEVVPGNEDIVGDGLRYRLFQPLEKRGSRYFRRVTARPK